MSTKEMTLFMRIRANGSEASKMFKQLNHDVVAFQKNQKELWAGIGAAAATPFKVIGAVGSVMFAPLKLAAEAAGLLTGGLIALGSAALYAAAEDEKLQSRLSAVAGSAEQGAHAMKVFESMSRHSSFKTEDLAEAAIVMKQYGVSSQRSLQAIASAAKVAGVGVGDLALQTMALQSRGMKRFGIEIDDAKDNPVIKFRDRMGQIRTIITKDADEARRKMIDIFALKFGTNIAPTTFSGLVSMLRNNIDQAFASFGEGLLRPAKRFIDYITGGLTSAIEGGKLEEWGKKAGEWLNTAVTKFMAFVDTVQQVFEHIPKLLEDGWKGLQSVLTAVLEGTGSTIGVALIEYLKASVSIFIELGKLIGSALKESVLSLDIPLMDLKRNSAVNSALERMTPDQMRERGMPEDFVSAAKDYQDVQAKYRGVSTREARMALGSSATKYEEAKNRFSAQAGPSGMAHIASFDAGADMKEAWEAANAAMKNAGKIVAQSAKESFSGVNTAFSNSTGFDTAGAYDANFARLQKEDSEQATHYGKENRTARFTELYAPDPKKPWYREQRYRDVTREVDKGQYNDGDVTPGGGVIIQIAGGLNVTSNNAGRVQHEVISAATRGTSLGYAK